MTQCIWFNVLRPEADDSGANLHRTSLHAFYLMPLPNIRPYRPCQGYRISEGNGDMTTRQAACDPCRKAKLACDHRRPVCTRCEQSQRTRLCTYRASPFKRRQPEVPHSVHQRTSSDVSRQQTSSATGSPHRISYPNPGYLGSSSHVAIFEHIPQQNIQQIDDSDSHNASSLNQNESTSVPVTTTSSVLIAALLHEFVTRFNLAAMKDLVEFWLTKGTNLALAQPYVQECARSMEYVLSVHASGDAQNRSRLASHLLRNSVRALDFDRTSTEPEYMAQFCGTNIRWETLGIFLSAVVRATYDVPFFPHVYTTDLEKQQLRSSVTEFTDHIIEFCLSLDHLNDLQLVFQYENCIVHSYVDGDYSLKYWRRLGDVIGSLFALGYHEDIRSKSDVPDFLIKLRKTAFARIYSADKNVAVFLGRPPRMSKSFCYFQFPTELKAGDLSDAVTNLDRGALLYDWSVDSRIDITSESRWTATCAFFKEDILEMLHNRRHQNHNHRAGEMTKHIEACWKALPHNFRLHGSLRQHSDRTPFERDFLVSTRLNYLHVRFLLQFVLLGGLADPDGIIIELAQEILSLVVETILLRDQIVNSGTGLTWKIAHYGLPAAGIILLAALKQRRLSGTTMPLSNRVWQDLNVLVAEIQMGTIVQPSEPSYALLSRATKTIQDFLESLSFAKEISSNSGAAEEQRSTDAYPMEQWIDLNNPDPWDLEIEFWQNLAEHPFIVGADIGV